MAACGEVIEGKEVIYPKYSRAAGRITLLEFYEMSELSFVGPTRKLHKAERSITMGYFLILGFCIKPRSRHCWL